LIDTPGHKNYISNTMSGLQISDIAILVVSAKEGEFESGFEKCG
jgi:peptide chain release factor subunit 3